MEVGWGLVLLGDWKVGILKSCKSEVMVSCFFSVSIKCQFKLFQLHGNSECDRTPASRKNNESRYLSSSFIVRFISVFFVAVLKSIALVRYRLA